MEYLASQLILKLCYHEEACCKTDANPESLEFHFQRNQIFTPTEFIPMAIDSIFEDRQMSYISSANFTSIGCSFAIYKLQGDKMILKCVQNEPKVKNSAEPYLEGKACSKCLPNQKCSERYPGLCEDVQILPVGPPGLPGSEAKTQCDPCRTGLNGAKGDIGLPGRDGMNGPIGIQGPMGPKGDACLPGVKGDRGMDGLVGPPGIDGKCEKIKECSNIFTESNPYFWFLYALAAFGVAATLFGALNAFNGIKSTGSGLVPWYSEKPAAESVEAPLSNTTHF